MKSSEGRDLALDDLRRMPKAELHVHLDGSLRPETMIELAGRDGRYMPEADPMALRRYMQAHDVASLVEYLERFDLTLSVMQSAESLERIAYELAEDLVAENVLYAEVRFSPILTTAEGLGLEEAVAAPLRGLQRAGAEHGIRTGVIICGIRSMDPGVTSELAELAVAFRGRGVVGFDLAGPEAEYPAVKHLDAFQKVRNADMGVTIHAGEAYGPESVRQALHRCGAHRIGHGTRIREDPELLRYVRDFRVPIEICPTSNVQTKVVAGYADHPLREYFDEGLVVSLNTDNRLISGTTMTREYERVAQHLGFGWNEIRELTLMAFESAFLPWPEKRALVDRARAQLEQLGREIAS
jgi:adenosine deaminase